MRRAIFRIWRRAVHCRRGEHRETVECASGVLRRRCVDCGWLAAIGWVCVGGSNRAGGPAPHPWQDDA